jgi:membrane-associated phospholipid phosphatase
VYLAQHFVTDVLAGLIVGLTSAFLALLMYERFKRQRKESTGQIEEFKVHSKNPL